MLADLPKSFVQNILGLPKTKGADWLNNLPKLVGEIERNWSLKAGEPFLAIDPKGIVGDIGFEISAFLNNPRGWVLPRPDRKRILAQRIEQFSEAFEIEPLELRKWAFTEAVLSAWRTFEESRRDWKKWIYCAEIWEV